MKKAMQWMVFVSLLIVCMPRAWAIGNYILIDNVDDTVSNSVAQIDVAGSMDGIVGNMSWNNDLTGVNGSFPAVSPWSVNGIALWVGDNTITVSGQNSNSEPSSDSVTITRERAPATYYVSTNGANVYPYTSWATAANTIQDAIDATVDGDTVMVGDGTYNTGGKAASGKNLKNRILVDRQISVESVNGSAETFIVGQGPVGSSAVRCAYLSEGAELKGFTLSNGHTLIHSSSDAFGGGVFLRYGGTVLDCVITDCHADMEGGGVYADEGGAMVRCEIVHNHALSAAGVYAYQGGSLSNCLVAGNTASYLIGGVRSYYGDAIVNCTIVDNTSTDMGVGNRDAAGLDLYKAGALYNSVIYNNTCNGTNFNVHVGGDGGVMSHNCTIPSRGVHCITNAPDFIDQAGGNYRMYQNSPCVDYGSNTYAANPIDLEGHNRIQGASVDLGTYEYRAGEDPNASPIHYVSTNSLAPLWPYTNWESASHTIQDAVNAASSNDTVLVTNGVYNTGRAATPGCALNNRVMINKPITVKSVNGRLNTLISGASDNGTNGPSAVRCAYLGNGGILSGFTLSGGYTDESGADANKCGGGAFIKDGVVTNCNINNCSARYGGGLCIDYTGGTVVGSEIYQNASTYWSGGALLLGTDGLMDRCIIRDNETEETAGGIMLYHGSTLRNCLIYDNQAGSRDGGGVYLNAGGTVENCTISGNRTSGIGDGGGVFFFGTGGTIVNSILIGNTAGGSGDNYYNAPAGAITYTCTTPDTGGEGCITNNPLFIGGGDYRLQTASPCISAGTNQAWMGGAVDLDGNPRIVNTTVDMGAYEYLPPQVAITNAPGTVYGETTACTISGTNNEWVVGTLWWTNAANAASGEFPVSGFEFQVAAIPLAFGDNTITVSGTNRNGDAASDSVVVTRSTIHSGDSPTHYVATTGAAVWPYTNWTDAATSIQDAVDAAYSGDNIIITNGEYVLISTISIDKDLTVRSVNGYGQTIINGGEDGYLEKYLCFYLGDYDILLDGLTVTNGCDDKLSGGIYCHSIRPVISNCWIIGNSTAGSKTSGGGINGGTLYHCIISGNSTGGGYGGGLYRSIAYNCLIRDNTAAYGGGAYDATLVNCTLSGNTAQDEGGNPQYGGGASSCTLTNCVVWSNTGQSGGNDLYSCSTAYTCASDGITNGINGCITNNPQFAGGGDYHLTAPSPCIDAGTNRVDIVEDLDGTPRPLDGDANGAATIDIGCYEHLNRAADSDGDTMTDGFEDDYGLDPTDDSDATGNPDADPHSNLQEFIADTDPTDSNDYFRVVSVSNLPPMTVYFDSSNARWYTLLGCTNLLSNDWKPVQNSRMGAGGADVLQSTNNLPVEFYKLEVEIP